ncbi:MAG TPA: 3-dehydroquinate synthase [Alphaproteobacteria bacterium]|nr:3-dehydroquinate synthase [Alphaproteobacteria bacterium]
MNETESSGKPATVRVELGDRSYDIVIGAGLLAKAERYIAPVLARPNVIVVTDRTVEKLYVEPLEAALARANIASRRIVLPPGERTKSFAYLEGLIEALLGLGVNRQTTLLALGGGVVGDLAGFAAAIVLRGIDFIQIPTTLLAQVDSSVGGKTGIDTRHGKNLAGAVHQPRLVLADVTVLDTLPRRELLAGYAEIVKYGLIRDAQFFAWLEGHGARLRDGDVPARIKAVVTSCAAKARIVAADEREMGDRALLNFGHTFGHALEAETGYSDELLHGEAVAIGMIMALDLSRNLGLCPAEDALRARRHFEKIGLPVALNTRGRKWGVASLLAHMRHDKKVRDGKVRFVLTRGLGKAFVGADVDMQAVVQVLERAVAA